MSDMLRSIYARWQNLEADKAAISEDLKELFAEAKSNGYDTKALRAAFRQANLDSAGAAALDEHAILVAVYLAEIVGTNDAPRAHPRIAHENSRSGPDDRDAAPHPRPIADGTQAGGNTGGSHVGDQNAQDIGKGGAGEGLKAVPRDPAPARCDDDMAIPAFMRRTA